MQTKIIKRSEGSVIILVQSTEIESLIAMRIPLFLDEAFAMKNWENWCRLNGAGH